MENLYVDPRRPGSFAGKRTLQRYAGESKRDVDRFLATQNAYTLHRPVRLRFQRRRTYAKGIDDLFQIDLADMSNVSSYNDSHRYLLTCIDVFSKYAWAVPLRTKMGREVALAFQENILTDRKCNMVQSDKGTEFLNSAFQTMLRDNGIRFYTSENDDIKASVVERFNRTLKERIYRYFTHKNTRRYIDVLDDIVHAYNNTHHRTIGMTPTQVNSENEQSVRVRIYPLKPKKFKWKYDIDDTVRISLRKRVFKKGYVGCWSEEVFKVSARHPTVPVTYTLVDTSGETIKGKFYEPELQKIIRTDDYYVVERILKTRKRGKKTYYFVKWRGYPDTFNSWTSDLKRV
jgi:transposase InsO family protein